MYQHIYFHFFTVPWLQIRHTGDKLLPNKPMENKLKGYPNYTILLWSWRFMSITVWRWNVCDLKLCPNAMFRSRTFWEMIESLGSWTNSPPNQWRDEWWLHYQEDYRKVGETVKTSFTQRKSATGSPPIFLVSGLFSTPLCFPEIMNSAAFSAVRFCLHGILPLPPAQPTETSDDG